jgi:hypothetical protein
MTMTTIASLNLSTNALTTLEEVGLTDADVAADVASIRDGRPASELLTACLRGVEDGERSMAWREYVDAVVAAAGR